MKKYVVKSAWDENKWIIENLSHPNDRVIGPAIDGEDPEWLQLEDVEDPISGELIPTLTVNETKKSQVLSARLQKEIDDADEKAAKDIAKKTKKDALKAFKNNKNKTLSDITKVLDEIVDYIQELDRA